MIGRPNHLGPLIQALAESPVVSILGPRQCGKTTLARELAKNVSAVVLDLESDRDRIRLASPELYLESVANRLVVLDEIQRMPELFGLLRSLVDRDRRPGRFLLLGSASPDLVKGVSESLAGRVRFHELVAFRLGEVGIAQHQPLFLRGGFPRAYLASSDRESLDWRKDFVRTFLERDLPLLGLRLAAPRIRRFWTMLAHAQGQLYNASSFARGLDLAPNNLTHWLDVLEGTFMVRRLLPWLANLRKRLTKSPKVYLRDSGLVHALLDLGTWDQLQGHAVIGQTWEGFCIEEVLAMGPQGANAFFYRTSAGAELDLVIEPVPGKPVGIEIKYSLTPKPSRGFWQALDDIEAARGYVLYPGADSWPLGKTVMALGIKDWGKVWEPG
jgi:uncharacterized protein